MSKTKSKARLAKKTIKLARTPKYQSIAAIVVVVAAAVLGYFLFIASHAASPYVSVEAVNGTLGGSACKVTSTGASGGSTNNAVQFGGTACTGGGNPTVPLLGLWAGGSGSASQFGVIQQVLSDFATPGGSTGTFTTYSVPSTNLQIMLAIGDLNSGQANTIGNALVSSGHANTMFRVMVEQNQCTWNTSWNESKFTAAQYVSAFQNVVTELRAVSGNQFKFIWNPNAGEGNNCNGETTQQTWPGAAYVDYVGVDVYDYGGYQSNTQQIVDFATGHPDSGWPQLSSPLPLAIPEWGLNGSEDTSFMNYMIGVIETPANHTAVQSYFSCPASECSMPESDLTKFPNSLAAYKAGFAGQ